jgi:hypothetical protein
MTLPEARADRVPRPPTRAFVNTAEPAKPAVKGVASVDVVFDVSADERGVVM